MASLAYNLLRLSENFVQENSHLPATVAILGNNQTMLFKL